MIKAETDGKITKIEIEGKVIEIASGAADIIKGIYNSISEDSKESGEAFKMAMQIAVTDESPIWMI
jgi:hypothetical protein